MDRGAKISTPVIPYDHRAEQSVLGCLLHSPTGLADIPDLRVDHFYHPVHRILFTTIQAMFLEGADVDAVTVFNRLREDGELKRAGGAPYLSELLQSFKTATSLPSYAGIVKDRWILRKVQEFGQQCQNIGERADEAPAAIEAVYRLLDEVETGESSSSQGFQDLLVSWEQWGQQSDEPAIPTPWPDMNEALNGGLNRQRLYIPVGRPGSGKSLAGLNMVLQAAQSGYSALIFSMEMSKVECTNRLIAAGAKVKAKNLFARSIPADDYDKIQQFRHMWADMNLTINDNPAQTIESIVSECRAHKQKHGLDVVFIDYAGLITPTDSKASRYLQMGHISKSCKIMARRLDCAVILACQANRGFESEDRNPRLSDLRESGDLESDADVVMFLVQGTQEQEGMVLIHLLKNRAGIPGKVIALENRYHQMRLG